MTRISRLRELFEAATTVAPELRDDFLAHACADDQRLREEVEALLACDTATGDPLAAGIAAAAALQFDTSTPWLGRRVGNYRILSELGRGGMGSVYLAERADREYESRVAIKLIRGFPTAEALERLRRERQVLAGLTHPHIARLLDGGTTEEGQPYLVIEYVEGLSLSQWWQQKRPPLALRLVLFQQLCLAVHHAHQSLIVHRDLKPANVMVRADDTPALLDFGIAKLVVADETGERITEMRAFTVDYASPEQLAGGAVTTASDVYGLGLILYELLCGKSYDSSSRTAGWRESRPAHVARRADAAWLRDDAARIAGDLDRIVQRALAEEPAHRYSSAAAVAGEIDRYFAGLPLEAGPNRLRYRATKFVQRHRVGVAAGVLALVCLLGASVWLALERNRAVHAERRAQLEARIANQVTEFLLHLFKDVDPEKTRGHDVSARELLDRGRGMLDAELADQPAVRARLLSALGEIYTSIGIPKSSIDLLQQAVVLLRAPTADKLQLAFALNELCRAYTSTSDYTHALDACREALALRQARLAPGDADLAHTYDALGVVEQELGDFSTAERSYRRALAIFSAAGSEHREDVASTHHNLGFLALHNADYAMARREYQSALDAKRALFGEAHPRTLNSLDGLAQSEQALGDLVAARRDFESVLKLRVAVHGAESVAVAHSRNDLAGALQDLGDYAAAETNYVAALDLYTRLEPPDAMDAASTSNNLATLDEDRGDFAGALPLLQRSLAVRQGKFPTTHPSLARAQHNLARCLLELGDVGAARPLLDAALITRRALPQQNAERFDSELLDAVWQLAAGHTDAAASALRVLRPPQGRGNYRRRARYAEAMASVAAAQHDWVAARTGEQQALMALRAELAMDHPLCAQAAVRQAHYAHALHDDDAAGALLRVALPVLRKAMVEQAVTRVDAEKLAADLKVKAG